MGSFSGLLLGLGVTFDVLCPVLLKVEAAGINLVRMWSPLLPIGKLESEGEILGYVCSSAARGLKVALALPRMDLGTERGLPLVALWETVVCRASDQSDSPCGMLRFGSC